MAQRNGARVPSSSRMRMDDGEAFLPDPASSRRPRVRSKDVLAEQLAEGFLSSVTAGEDENEARDRFYPEERGGPFLRTSGKKEFGYDPDESNPVDAEPAAFPTSRSRRQFRP